MRYIQIHVGPRRGRRPFDARPLVHKLADYVLGLGHTQVHKIADYLLGLGHTKVHKLADYVLSLGHTRVHKLADFALGLGHLHGQRRGKMFYDIGEERAQMP